MDNKKEYYVINRSDTSLTVLMNHPYTNKVFEGYGKGCNFTLEELKVVNNTRGGRIALKNYLQILDEREEVEKVLDALNIEVEEEYFYNAKIVKYLLHEGSLDQLEDTLNFAPKGVVDLIKTLAVKLRLSDMNKITLISDKTGYDVLQMIQIDKEQEELRSEAPKEVKGKRKANPINLEEVEEKGQKATKRKSTRRTSSKDLTEEAEKSGESNDL